MKQLVEEITVLPLNKSNNKGSRERIVRAAEKSITGKKRQKRECKTLLAYVYRSIWLFCLKFMLMFKICSAIDPIKNIPKIILLNKRVRVLPFLFI